ncbi:BQ5605_C018g08760 [Microbotryum silenes-dioicae]|uniref:BQ5605_C018g08760 protein n=1 Tax=Microbotryum silenes-dioicae TaxID=796604 RepID=A0A2X0LWX5_9BASI|nr:BQ5605_C018g08760 [Microbotryum silenes-dioicae]
MVRFCNYNTLENRSLGCVAAVPPGRVLTASRLLNRGHFASPSCLATSRNDPKEWKSVENATCTSLLRADDTSLPILGLPFSRPMTRPMLKQRNTSCSTSFILSQAQIIRLPSLLRHESRQLALDLNSLIQHRRAHQCAHLRAVLLKGRHGATTSTAQDPDPTSKAKLSEHGEVHSSVLRGLVQSRGAARLEAVSGVARSIRWTGQATFSRFSTANETENIGYIEDRRKEIRMQLRARQYTAFAKNPPFGSIDGNVTSATPLKIGSLVCFGLKRSITPVSCDASNIGEEQLSIGLGSYISR